MLKPFGKVWTLRGFPLIAEFPNTSTESPVASLVLQCTAVSKAIAIMLCSIASGTNL
jgi:hypothetical protein